MSAVSDIATLFLTDIGAPVSQGNVQAVSVWLNAENSNPTLRNNPWNLHSSGGLPGQTGSDYVSPQDTNVAVFSSIQSGVAANAANFVHAGYYDSAVAALQGNNPTGFLNAIAQSPWSASGYGLRMYVNAQGQPISEKQSGGHWVPNPAGTNRLLAAYTAGGGVATSGPTTTTTKPTSGGGLSIPNPSDILKGILIAMNPALGGLINQETPNGLPFADIVVNFLAFSIGVFLIIIGILKLAGGPDVGEAIAAGLSAGLAPVQNATARPSATSAGSRNAAEYSPETPRTESTYVG